MDDQPQEKTVSIKVHIEKFRNKFLTGRNSIIVCVLILLAVLIICYAATTNGNRQSMELNPQDSDSGNAEITFSNSAVAVDSDVEMQNSVVDSLQQNSALTVNPSIENTDSYATSDSESPAQTEFTRIQNQELNEEPQITPQASEEKVSAVNESAVSQTDLDTDNSVTEESFGDIAKTDKTVQLYCGKFKDQSEASTQKAKIAFSTGQLSTIVKRNHGYQLFLGTFNSRKEAVLAFNKLDSLDLVDECELVFNH